MTMRAFLLCLSLPAVLVAQEDLGTLLSRARSHRDAGHLAPAVADYDAMLAQVPDHETALVDARTPAEFTGEDARAARGGHIPGAANIPWTMDLNEDGTFKPAAELAALYGGQGVTPDKDVIAYCRIGERSSHTWFVLRYLLGYPRVRNYDGSWTEWGNLVGAPVEKP